jgi:hypothetical protein
LTFTERMIMLVAGNFFRELPRRGCMILHHRPVRAGVVAVLGLGMTAAMGSLGSVAAAAAPAGPVPMVTIAHSVAATTDPQAGPFTSRNMTVQVALRPRNAAGLNRSLRAMYTKGSGSFHHWLAKGAFNARYAPTTATRNAVASYLRHAGLTVRPASSPFLVRPQDRAPGCPPPSTPRCATTAARRA